MSKSKSSTGIMPCSKIHSPADCNLAALKRMVGGTPKATKLYFPIHMLPVLIFKRHKLLKTPGPIMYKVIQNTLRSTFFLTVYGGVFTRVMCLLRTVIHPIPQQE
eukprot:TRINITY_DN887_c0_g1_i1.p1 TRINITY_DN887_c0_g1~~TRINITY_DN887_c0_g1_i1.p1  ORF type:complete len:120 (+),score=21.35 TRINITY_DN887_c0_g1_i1:48-362(+)